MKIDERYLALDVNGLHIQVKLEDEGVVLDVFDDGEVIATTYKFYNEFGVSIAEHPADKGDRLYHEEQDHEAMGRGK